MRPHLARSSRRCWRRTVMARPPRGEAEFWKLTRRVKSGCLVWKGVLWHSTGRARWNKETAARVAFRYARGEIPDGLLVCHHCDNILCVEPSHLFLGTYSDNANDMVRKGRQNSPVGDRNGSRKHPERLPHGDRHWTKLNPERIARGTQSGPGKRCLSGILPYNAKLTPLQVKEVFSLKKKGLNRRQIGDKFGITKLTVWRILTGRSYKTLRSHYESISKLP